MGRTNFDEVDGAGGFFVNGTQVIDSSGKVIADITAPSGSIGTGEIADKAVTVGKMADMGAEADILVASAAKRPVSVAMSGDATIAATGALTIAAKAISAAKMADMGAEADIFVADANKRPVSVAMSGDATIDATGAVAVSDLTIASQAAGDILYFNGTNWVRLPIGTAGQVLKVNAGATAPEWAAA